MNRAVLRLALCALLGLALKPGLRAQVPIEAGEETVIVPKINVPSERFFWADGVSPAVISISLEATKGDRRWIYKPTEDISFLLEPRNAAFNPSVVRIPRGADRSEPATLTLGQPDTIEVTCIPEREYNGLAIKQAQPIKIQFLTPINKIGIEPVSGKSQVNTAAVFQVFLFNDKDKTTRLRPTNPVSIQLESQSGNGTIDPPVFQLTEQEFTKLVRYTGTKTGRDTIIANASYENLNIKGQSERLIVFPLWIFLGGLAGSLGGALLRAYKGSSRKRGWVFLESFVFGLIFCFIVILFPLGTRLTQINNFLQPLLMLPLAALVSSLGPEFLKLILSFVSSRSSSNDNG